MVNACFSVTCMQAVGLQVSVAQGKVRGTSTITLGK